MKVAIVYNRDSKSVINLFGIPNQEKIGLKTVKRISDALKDQGHTVSSFEGDKDLIGRLEDFMPRVVSGERPGMVFNVSYGIQGQARYTHVPSILEMVGIPYVGSGPLAHSLALDKVVSKMMFRQHGLPTPDFAVLQDPSFEDPELTYPVIVKPKNEAVSFGIKVANNLVELREAAGHIFDAFNQPVLAEQYIEGREINVGLLGNHPAETLPPVELTFGDGPQIYTYEDKIRKSGREIGFKAPAPLGEELTAEAQRLARRAFEVLGCYDCSRVDLRLDDGGNFFILEINSLPSMGEHGSYVVGAELVGLDFDRLVNRLVEVASARYFGTPNPPQVSAEASPQESIFSFLTSRRDRLEKELQDWVSLSSRTSDPIGVRGAAARLDRRMKELALHAVPELTDGRFVWGWETAKGRKEGTLLIAHLDVPLDPDVPSQGFRRDPDWLYGEGIGCSRAPLVALEWALRSLRHQRRLRSQPLSVIAYADEGSDADHSFTKIIEAASEAKNVLVLRPGNTGDHLVTERRGLRRYRFRAEVKPRRFGRGEGRKELNSLVFGALGEITALSDRGKHLAVTAKFLETDAYPMMLNHRFRAVLLVSHPGQEQANETEDLIRKILSRAGFKWELEQFADRPPLRESRANQRLVKSIREVASTWEIPIAGESSAWPSVAGLVKAPTPVTCGLGPVGRDLYTPQEAVDRTSLLQRTLLLAQWIGRDLTAKSKKPLSVDVG